jgi:hypothetical protein
MAVTLLLRLARQMAQGERMTMHSKQGQAMVQN